MNASEPPVTYVEEARRGRRIWAVPLAIVLALLFLTGLATVLFGLYALYRLQQNTTEKFADIGTHFEHGSIGAEEENGLPFLVWQALPHLFPEHFEGRRDYSAFGFLYRRQKDGQQEPLPIGISRRNYRGVDLVWFNCAVCHTGTWRASDRDERRIVHGMPSNNLDLYRFIRFFMAIATDERLKPETLLPAIEQAAGNLNPIEKIVWSYYVIPRVREGLVLRHSRLAAFISERSAWGPGRVDTFNPYKLVQMQMFYPALAPEEREGVADFPSIFMQGPRKDMHLHWDGNNKSLAERNLSAALGAGVTPTTVEHPAIERVAKWLLDLPPPRSPHKVDAAARERGRAVYARECQSCHGYQAEDRYVFEGDRLGKVEPNSALGVDPGRLDSYTRNFRQRQLNELFAGTPYQFKNFTKTDGYANLPLDALWLRGPYLHNGSVPTLRALLSPPGERPAAFIRGIDVIDAANGGFVSPPCDPAQTPQKGFCFDTRLPGNGNGGHAYGVALPASDRDDLLAYLLTF